MSDRFVCRKILHLTVLTGSSTVSNRHLTFLDTETCWSMLRLYDHRIQVLSLFSCLVADASILPQLGHVNTIRKSLVSTLKEVTASKRRIRVAIWTRFVRR